MTASASSATRACDDAPGALRTRPAARGGEGEPGDHAVVDHDGRAARDGKRHVVEPRLQHLGSAPRPLDRRLDLLGRHPVGLAQIRRPVRRHGSEAQPVRVHPLDVDGGERRLELARDLGRCGDPAPRDADDHGAVELDAAKRLGEDAAARGAIPEERRDPRDDPHQTRSYSPTPSPSASTGRHPAATAESGTSRTGTTTRTTSPRSKAHTAGPRSTGSYAPANASS